MSQSLLSTAVPVPVANKLRLIRRRTAWLHVGSAVVAALAVLLAAMALAMLVDWMATLYDSRWRLVLTGAALAASALTVGGWLVVAWRRALGWGRLAGDVDRQAPQLQERWTTMTRLRPADTADPQRVHPAMLRRVAGEAARWEPHIRPEQVVSLAPLVRTLIALSAIAAVLAIAAALNARQTLVLLQRFWLPGSSISATSLVKVTGHVVVGRGEPLTLSATAQGTPVGRATLLMHFPDGEDRTVSLAARGSETSEFTHALRAVEAPFAYRFRAGDGQTAWFNVGIAERPEIKSVQLTVTPPAYAKRPPATVDKFPPRLSAMQGSELEVAVLPKDAVSHVALMFADDESVSLARGADGWFRWTTTLDHCFAMTPRLTESHGLTNSRAPKTLLNVYPDKPPVVKVVTPDDEVAVRPDDTIEITVSAQDDVGVAEAELLVYDGSETGDNQKPIATIPIPLGDQKGNQSIEKSVELDLKQFKVTDGAKLSYEVRVREDRGNAPAATATGQPAPSGAQSATANAPTTPNAQASANAQASSTGAPPTTSNPATGSQSEQQTPDNSQAAESAQAPNNSQASTTASAPRSSTSQPPTPEAAASSSTPGPQSPSSRMLDVPQSSTSQRRSLKIDEWAGSFASQEREKMEMAIAPELEALDKELAQAQSTARGVLDGLETDPSWRPALDNDVTSAQRTTVAAQKIISSLQRRSKDTPYAFIGLQVADIGVAHVEPARLGFWTALEAKGDARKTAVHDAWEHLGHARKLLADLCGQFERTRAEFQLAETVERVKKMYQVYIENTQALLDTFDRDPQRYQRKMAELNLDDDYLARLKEVLEMRRKMEAELARILGNDPRLLRRFMDLARNRAKNLREELSRLVANQDDLNREVRAWAAVDDADRPRIAQLLLVRQVQDMGDIAMAATELESRYETWLPLDREAKDADVAAATAAVAQVAAAATELNDDAAKFVTEAQRPRQVAPPKDDAANEPDADGSQPAAEATPEFDSAAGLRDLLAKGQTLYEKLNGAEVALRQLSGREDAPDVAAFAVNRLVEVRRMIADASAWIRQIQAHSTGNYARAAEVDQYRLAMKTDELAGKLGGVEQTLAALLQAPDGKLPEPIAKKAREFLALLDQQASPNQLAAVYALRGNQAERAVVRQQSAGSALNAAEKAYDEMMKLAIAELDKLPVQDPIADLLDDPTFDELLAQLEQEAPLNELLGIPARPTNLQILGDWLRPNQDGGLAAAQARMLQQQMRMENQRNRRRIDQAYRRAISRALKEAAVRPEIADSRAARLTAWNRLASKLGDDLMQGRDKAPPEQYRRAIEQYFLQISRETADGAGGGESAGDGAGATP